MLFSMKWLQEMVEVPCETQELLRKFNLMSQEIEDYHVMSTASGLTTGYVQTCVMHPQSDHLHICNVLIAKDEVLQIVCGAPNVEAGQKVIVALVGAVLPGDFKIKPSIIRGVESNGMICSLDELGIDHKYHQEDGIHVLPAQTVIGSDPLKILEFDDEVIDLHLTPNRGDLMSMMGVAFEVSAMLGGALHETVSSFIESTEKNPIKVASRTALCKSYYARVIKNVVIKSSPEWMKARLIAAGIRPINNIVDITNYVMLETGQPLHAFDFDKLCSHEIIVRTADHDKTIVTLDGKTRELLPGDIVITDGVKPVALAGVMGGQSTQIDESTRSILIESATFDGLQIRKTSKRLDLRSESSSRFERGLDPNRTLLAVNRAAELLYQLAEGDVLAGTAQFETQTLVPLTVDLSLSQLIKVTGYHYSEKLVGDVFHRLNFDFTQKHGVFHVSVPTRRIDIKTYQDLIEEVVRIAGYDIIPTTLHASSIPGYLTLRQNQRRMIRDTLVTLGLNETVSYSLTSEKEATLFDSAPQPVVKLVNPIIDNRGVLRHSQIPALLEILDYNLARKHENVHLFEIGKGYYEQQEVEYISGILSGKLDTSAWQGNMKPVDFFILKGLLNALFARIGVQNVMYQTPESSHPKLHPGISAELMIGTRTIGYVGKLHPNFQATKSWPDTFVFEIEMEALVTSVDTHSRMRAVSKFPSVSRDIAVVVDGGISAKQVIDAAKRSGINALADVEIFDLYVGDKINDGQKSIALSLIFQDFSKTFSTEEIDQMVSTIVRNLSAELNAVLRS